jgi:DNA (cytosine-5)-methyltransferase 1
LWKLQNLHGRLLTVREHRENIIAMGYAFFEFFAGGGMARAGLGNKWKCLFANDYDLKKGKVYNDNWGAGSLLTKDVRKLAAKEVPGRADLIWASFPCQDLSLAGMGAGLKGDRSGTFWPFWKLVCKLIDDRRGPKIIVLENVCGTLSSHNGKDFAAISTALASRNFQFGAVVIDAVKFVPQSRPRLFIIAVAEGTGIPSDLTGVGPSGVWHSKALLNSVARLDQKTANRWLWWSLCDPPLRRTQFADLIEKNPESVVWNTLGETKRLLAMMSPLNLKKVEAAQNSGQILVGTVYKRTRLDEKEEKIQRAEIRFDGVAGCLRTSSGGSSRQSVVIVNGREVRSRLLSSREAARLMGLPDKFRLPSSYNEAYHLLGDGLVVPVVRYLADQLLEPILDYSKPMRLDVSRNPMRAECQP